MFNQVHFDSDHTTELDLLHPSNGAVNIQMQLLGIGSTPAAKPLTIPAKGIARVDAATFFGITATSPGAYVTATGDGDIAGFEFVKSSNGDLLEPIPSR